VTVGVSGYSEFVGQIEAGELNVIGITAPETQPYTDAPTFAEQGFDLDIQNWRMIAGAAEISEEEKAALIETIGAMAESETWNQELESRGWVNTYLAGDEFAAYLDEQRQETEAILQDLGIAQ
jgi:putative tricarboxylic transport membrane protein